MLWPIEHESHIHWGHHGTQEHQGLYNFTSLIRIVECTCLLCPPLQWVTNYPSQNHIHDIGVNPHSWHWRWIRIHDMEVNPHSWHWRWIRIHDIGGESAFMTWRWIHIHDMEVNPHSWHGDESAFMTLEVNPHSWHGGESAFMTLEVNPHSWLRGESAFMTWRWIRIHDMEVNPHSWHGGESS